MLGLELYESCMAVAESNSSATPPLIFLVQSSNPKSAISPQLKSPSQSANMAAAFTVWQSQLGIGTNQIQTEVCHEPG